MRHPFRIREIAVQAGLSEATVDRVLHERGGVHASTSRQVHQAVEDLRRQQSQLRLGGRTFLVDVVVDAPAPFCAAVRAATEAELPGLHPAVIRARFHFTDGADPAEIAARLGQRRGAHGVVLKVPDVVEVSSAAQRLVDRGVPVVTLVTDLPSSARTAYVGIDNRAAGATAAYLLAGFLGTRPGNVLVVRGSGLFRGEDEREMGFRGAMRAIAPDRAQADVLDLGAGSADLKQHVHDALAADPSIEAAYSMYSMGNQDIVAAFGEAGRACRAFVAHDLTGETRALLRDGRLTAVLNHDLGQDLRRACQLIMQANGALPGTVASRTSSLQVITPYNIPLSPA